ncbi:MAG TPA: DNA repair protein RecO [Candidatus Baltobacteraceae bacterium]|nr:DNA repair protein RecO [Candidatus Baltobacteraceae bacterium]
MSSTYHVRGVILRRESWRDAARMYTIYTREAGKLLAVGRGTRKLLSKLGAHLEPHGVVDLHLARGRKTETVCGAIMVRPPDPFAADDRRYLAVSFAAEMIDHFVKTGDPDPDLWRLIEAWHADLAAVPADRIDARLSAFVWRFMSRLGYRPKLDECSECGRPLRFGTARFLPVPGTAACGNCHLDERSLVGCETLAQPSVDAIGRMLDDAASATPAYDPAAFASALSFMEARLDRPLSSLPLVRAMMKAKAYV